MMYDGGKERQFASGLARMPFPVVVFVHLSVDKLVEGFSRVLVFGEAKPSRLVIKTSTRLIAKVAFYPLINGKFCCIFG